MKYLWLLFIATSSFAADLPAKRLMWWELPRAVKADKKPYFEALNKYRRNTTESAALADHLTSLVLCEMPVAFAERDCPRWKKDSVFSLVDANESISLSKFSVASQNARFVLRAFAGMLEGAKVSLPSAQQAKIEALLTNTGVLIAADVISENQWQEFLAAVTGADSLWTDIASNVSLKAYVSFVREFREWIRLRPGKTNLTFKEYNKAIPIGAGLCYIEKNALKCEGNPAPFVDRVPVFQDLQQIASVGGLMCALDAGEVKCWRIKVEGQDHANYYQNPPLGLKNPYFLASNEGDTFCALDEEGMKCWSSVIDVMDRPQKDRPKAVVVPNNNYRLVAVSESDWSPVFSASSACALGTEYFQCWQHGAEIEKEKTSSFRNPREIYAGRGFFCALDDNGPKCWGLKGYSGIRYKLKIPAVETMHGFKQMAVSYTHACFLFADRVECLGGDGYGESHPPVNLGGQQRIITRGVSTCAEDAEGWNCWGLYNSRKSSLPKRWLNPRKIVTLGSYYGGYSIYALDDEGIKKWDNKTHWWWGTRGQRHGMQNVLLTAMGWDGQLGVATSDAIYMGDEFLMKVTSPREMTIDYYDVCVIDEDGLKCKKLNTIDHKDQPVELLSPASKHPRSLSKRRIFIDDDGLHHGWNNEVTPALLASGFCYAPTSNEIICANAMGNYHPPVTVKGIKKLISDELSGQGGKNYCLEDSEGIKCWNDEEAYYPTMPLINPRELAVTRGLACALDDEGLKCWGDKVFYRDVPPPKYPEVVITK